MGTKYATSTATQNLPSYLQNAYQGIVGQAGQTASTPYTPYTGGFTPDQQTAFGNIGALAGSSNPAFLNSSTALGSTMNPTYSTVGNYMSPYISNVADAMKANFAEMNGQQQQGVVGNAITKGAYGGNRVGVAQSELARQQSLANNQSLADLYNTGYGTALGAAQADKTAALGAASGYSNLGSTQMQTGLAQGQAQLGAGTQQQQFDYQQYLNSLAFPYQQQSWLASIAGGLAPSAGGTTTESKPEGNIFSQLLGAGLGIAGLFKDGGRIHAAGGGVMPYANDNGQWSSYMAQAGLVPFANDNGTFPSYVPQVAQIGGGGGGFPTISPDQQQDDPFAVTSDQMKAGASNLKGWLTPKSLHAGYNLARGGVAGNYAGGGEVMRRGYAGGGRNEPRPDIAALYSGILEPSGGLVGGSPLPPPSTVDAVSPLNGDRLGLGLGNTSTEPPPLAYTETPDDRGLNAPPPMRGLRSVGAPSSGVAGGVPFSSGDQFTTAPAPGYSQNVGDAWKSLTAGNGLNLSPDMRQSLLAAGMGMMASKSPFALAGIGEGGLTGIEAWNERQKLERDNAAQRAANAQTGSNIALQAEQAALTGAQAGRESQATSIDRWDFTPSMAGMVIKDKVTPTGSFVIPYDQLAGWATQNGVDPKLLPAAQPQLGPDGVSMNVEPPADAKPSSMGFTAPELVKGQTDTALTDARKAYTASQEAGVQLGLMKESEKNLPADGFLSPGTWASERASFAKQANSLSQVLGLDPVFDPNAVSASEELHKLTTQFGFALSRTTGSDIASSVVNQAIGAVPSIENTPQGFQAVVSSIQAGLNRQKDYYQFLQKWANKTGGDITGADEYFNKVAPPSAYANAAVLSAAIVPKTQDEIDKAPPGTLFNVGGKLMQKP